MARTTTQQAACCRRLRTCAPWPGAHARRFSQNCFLLATCSVGLPGSESVLRPPAMIHDTPLRRSSLQASTLLSTSPKCTWTHHANNLSCKLRVQRLAVQDSFLGRLPDDLGTFG